jgi:hypothetical protein
MSADIDDKIRIILDNNKINDIQRFINKRQCLNSANMYLIYIFHIMQAAGILTTSVAAGYSIKELVWIGVGLNILATLITIFEQTNNNISKKILQNIEAIQSGKYVDEDTLVNPSSLPGPAPQSTGEFIGDDLRRLIGQAERV